MLSHRGRLPYGATLAIISGVFPESLRRTVDELQRAGYATQVLYVGDEHPETTAPPGAAFYDLSEYFRTQEAASDWE